MRKELLETLNKNVMASRLRRSIPFADIEIFDKASIFAIKHPLTNELIILKDRLNLEPENSNGFLYFNEISRYFVSNDHLFNTNILYDTNLLNPTGKAILGIS